MSKIQQQIEKLRTYQEFCNDLADKVEVQLPALATALREESATIQSKIDNIDLSSVAKQGSNADATNTAILDAVKAIESWSAKYDSTTGDLTIENVNITIE